MVALVTSAKQVYNDTFSKENLDKVKNHLSQHYHFYKALSATLMGLGAVLSFELVGYSWPKIPEKILEPILGCDTFLGKAMGHLANLASDLAIPIIETAGRFFDCESASFFIKGCSYLLGAGFSVLGSSVFLTVLSPAIFTFTTISLGAFSLPLIPGMAISFAGKALWNLTEKPNLEHLKQD